MFRRSVVLTALLCLAMPLARAAADGRALRPAVEEEVVGMRGSNPGRFAILGSKMYFPARGPEGLELRWTDGTNVGLVKDIFPGTAGGGVHGDVATLGDHVYFFVFTGNGTNELWRSDGTADGTVKVKEIRTEAPAGFWKHGNLLFFYHYGSWFGRPMQLWRTDGTTDGTFQVKEFDFASNATSSGEYLYFNAGTSEGAGVWRTDGTTAGTIPLFSGPATFLTDLNGTLYFGKIDVAVVRELWKTNGTPESTVAVRQDLLLYDIARMGNHLYLRVAFNQLWKSDGTNEGTALLKDFSPYWTFSTPTVVGSRLFFFLRDPSGSGVTLVATDGTPQGIGFLKYFPQIRNDTMHAMAGGDLFYFPANDDVHGTELWRSDATPGGTFMVKDIDWRRDPDFGGPYSSGVTLGQYWNGVMYFSAIDVHSREPWRSDGTPNGTYMLANIQPDGTFRGRVTDANGAGIPTATVSVWRRNNDNSMEKATDYPVDAQGHYSAEGLSEGTYIAKVKAAGYVTAFYDGTICGPCMVEDATGIPVAVGETTVNIDFSLERAGAISGTVRNSQTQAGAAGVPVFFSDQKNGFVYAYAVTDSQGHYTTPMTLPPGVYAAWTDLTSSYRPSEYIGFYCGVGRGVDDFTPIPVMPAQTTPSVDFSVDPTF